VSATVDTNTDWQGQVLDLKRQGMTSAEIAELVGKHAATVRKVIARAKDDEGPIQGQTTVEEHIAAGADPEQFEPPAPPEYEPPEDPLHAFKQEAGEAVGDMPKEPEPDPIGYEVRVKGTRQMALDFGPEADTPLGATLVLKSEKRASGFYGLGDVITGTFTARVTKAPGEEKFDKASEEYRAQPTAYVATITEYELD
jgi:hypothetical protein